MNTTLYKRMLGIKLKGFLNYAIGSAFYILFMLWVYPSLAGNTKQLDEMIQALPEGLASAFGFSGGFGSVDSFISGEFYGLILLILLGVFVVQTANSLLAKLVDQGSMAYLLAVPTTRAKVIWAQAAIMTTGLLLIQAITTAAGFAGYAWLIGSDYAFDTAAFCRINLMAFLLFFAMGGLAFLISAVCNDEKRATGISGVLVFVFYTLDLLGKIASKLDWMRSLTPFSLYRPSEIAAGQTGVLVPALVLAAIGIVCFSAAAVLFGRRDLPL